MQSGGRVGDVGAPEEGEDALEEDSSHRARRAHFVAGILDEAGADHDVGVLRPDRLEQGRHVGGIMLSVGIHLHQLGVPTTDGEFIPGLDGRAVAEVEGVGDDEGAMAASEGCGLIARPVVDDENVDFQSGRSHGVDDAPDRGLLVERGDDQQAAIRLR